MNTQQNKSQKKNGPNGSRAVAPTTSSKPALPKKNIPVPGPGPGPGNDSDIASTHVPKRIKPNHVPRSTLFLREDSDSESFGSFVKSLKGKEKATEGHIEVEGEDSVEENEDEENEDEENEMIEDEDEPQHNHELEHEEGEDEEEDVEEGEDEEGAYVEGEEMDEDDEVKESHTPHVKSEDVYVKRRYQPRKARMVNKHPCDTCVKRNKTCHMQDSIKARGACFECGSMKIKCIFTVSFFFFFFIFYKTWTYAFSSSPQRPLLVSPFLSWLRSTLNLSASLQRPRHK